MPGTSRAWNHLLAHYMTRVAEHMFGQTLLPVDVKRELSLESDARMLRLDRSRFFAPALANRRGGTFFMLRHSATHSSEQPCGTSVRKPRSICR